MDIPEIPYLQIFDSLIRQTLSKDQQNRKFSGIEPHYLTTTSSKLFGKNIQLIRIPLVDWSVLFATQLKFLPYYSSNNISLNPTVDYVYPFNAFLDLKIL